MELELKHITPYLPYGLRVYVEEYGIEFIIGCIDGEVITEEDNASLDTIKPIFRPLSDLTKEIDCIDGKLKPFDYLWFDTIGTDSDCFDRAEFEVLIEYDTILAPIKAVNKLFEWHFDVFGLIPQGLAIDINTIK